MKILFGKFHIIRKKGLFFSIIFFFIFCLSFFSSCKNNGSILDFYNFNTFIHVESYSVKIENDTKNKIQSFLDEVENKTSLNIQSSTISTFNNANIGETVILDDYSFDLIKKSIYGSDSVLNKTNGKFNIAVLPLVKLWKLSSDTFNANEIITSIPTNTEIENKKILCDTSKIQFDVNNKTLTKLENGVEIDLGGIAKGYIAEKIASILKENGICDGYLSLGSSSLYVFNVNSLSLRHPRRNQILSEIIKMDGSLVKNKNISTSGDYERYYEIGDTRYCHVIDSETGSPTQTGIISTTVIGDDGAFLDTLSTTLMLLQYNPNDHENSQLIKYIKTLENENIKYFICYENGEKILLTNYGRDEFTLLDNTFTVKQI